MDDEALIQNRYAMLSLLEKLPAIYAETRKAYQFLPGAYSFDVMRMLGGLLQDAREITGVKPMEET